MTGETVWQKPGGYREDEDAEVKAPPPATAIAHDGLADNATTAGDEASVADNGVFNCIVNVGAREGL